MIESILQNCSKFVIDIFDNLQTTQEVEGDGSTRGKQVAISHRFSLYLYLKNNDL